ncbi:MAG: HAD-IC family P-type ATPase, partial [Actinobacteria bacterium]|nr:HAD-IC family P-type ATPase [Actinomycetota bacterium]
MRIMEESKAAQVWHTLSAERTIEQLDTDISKGLSQNEAERRLDENGLNELEEKKGRSPFKIFISQFNDFMIWILIAAALISGIIIREIADAVVILIILVINSVLGFVQEYRAEKALQALKELAAPAALIVRDGSEKQIISKLLVSGDIIKLSGGDLVPADCRILNEVSLQANESIITGESLPVDKSTDIIEKENIPLGDRLNMLFSGTTVVKGRCTAVVTGTGKNTEIGKIASLVQQKEEMTPLQQELKTVGTRIGIICLAVSAIVFAAGIIKGFMNISQGLITATRADIISEMLLVAVALAVASIPEGLPAIVTISLALGVQKMAKNNAIVRRLSSVETLGSVSVICTDKTGTLTQNKMIVRKIFPGLSEFEDYSNAKKESVPAGIEGRKVPRDNPALRFLIENAVLCNDAHYLDKKSSKIAGDPTEAALIELGSFYSIDKTSLEFVFPREYEEPFDSVRKMMTTVHKISEESLFTEKDKSIVQKCISATCSIENNEINKNEKNIPAYIMFTKGAPEAVLNKCTKIIKDGNVEDLSENDK